MPPPEEWVIGRVCEEFGCLPSQAVREIERDADLVFRVLALRAYAQTKRAMDTAQELKDQPKGVMAELVRDIEYELWQERRQAQQAEYERTRAQQHEG